MNGNGRSQSLGVILRRIGDELADSAKLVDAMHLLIEEIDLRSIANTDAFFRSAQSIDIVQQRLEGLAHYANELASMSPPDWELQSQVAANKLKLSSLAARMRNQGVADQTPDTFGDFESL